MSPKQLADEFVGLAERIIALSNADLAELNGRMLLLTHERPDLKEGMERTCERIREMRIDSNS